MFRRQPRQRPTPAAPDPRTEMRVTRSVSIARAAGDVFAFIDDPASMRLLDDDVLAGVRMPGTGPGAGEVQVFLHRIREGRAVRSLEVLEHDPGARALVRSLDALPAGMLEVTTEVTVAPDGLDRCVLTHSACYVLAAPALAEPAASEWSAYLHAWFESMHTRAKRVLEPDWS